MSEGLIKGLVALDETLRKAAGGDLPEGVGLFGLLDQLAVTTLGAPRSTFPLEEAPKAQAQPEPPASA